MDVRRVLDGLCRSYTTLSLSTTLSRTALARRPLNPWTCQSCRKFASYSPCRQSDAAFASSREGETQNSHDMYRSRDTGLLPARNSNTAASSSSTGDGNRSVRTRKNSPQGKPSERAPSGVRQTSLDDLVNAGLEVSRKALSKDEGYGWPKPSERNLMAPGSSTSRFTSEILSFPTAVEGTNTKPPFTPRVLRELDIHVKPRTGRSLAVNPRNPTELGAKIRALGSLVGRNKIKRDAIQQKFHERPGLKRKRLARERWRTYFGNRFRSVVARVNELRAQGW
ncbi:uncharacterized protein PV09_03169 [Verruconis gallopava]|uniref:Ribosomal protein S21 n=1 Tax=Verruconis gallopava TaxID=253628 RepID=A0A0D2AHG4_9PEZI|nr:uncharacterized protein PV09_03169 [Verruconis gallopava]KIW05985.1 hypothetical protein PV09_03169 [Verruconis gallopava]